MKQYAKRIVLVVSMLVLIVTTSLILKNGSNTASAKDITVHFKWEGEIPHIYYENLDGDSKQVISWPGIPMNKEGNGWYSYTIKEAESADIIFSVSDVTYQTASINKTAGEWWFDQDTWYTENPDLENTATAAEDKADNSKSDVITVGSKRIETVDEYIDTYVKTQDLAEAKDASIIIHYYAEGAVPSIYYWNSLPQNMETVWPGQAMTLESENWYQYTFQDVTKVNLLFTYGLQQTKDLTRTTGEWWYKGGKWYSKKPEDTIEPTPIPSERTDFREESIYFVMTTRFYDGDKENNVHCWDENIKTKESDPAWRGDFKGLIEKLDYIKALGFSAIWVTPVVENCSGLDYHGYHAMNFQKVDPRYESDGVTYQTLINEVHKRGMKIVQDVVFNHTGNFGEENLMPMFTKDATVEGGYESIDCLKASENSVLPAAYFDKTPFLNAENPEGAFGTYQYEGVRLPLMKDTKDPIIEGQKNDPYSYYHHYGYSNWDFYDTQIGQIAGDCVDLNTENPLVAKYITDSYAKYIAMGVDSFRVDTARHISRLTFNNYFNPVFKAIGGENFYMFGEVCARSSEVWYQSKVPAFSAPFYTWADNKDYKWVYYDETTQAYYDKFATVTYEKTRSDFTGDDGEKNYFAYRKGQEADTPHGINLESTEDNFDDNSNIINGEHIEGRCTQENQPISTNAFLEGNEYHKPDNSEASGLNVIDFQMHRNFNTAKGAFGIATTNYDFEKMKVNVRSVGGDYSYNDATWNVVYVDSHDYGPDRADGYRYQGSTEDWAENLALMFTFRGIPCLYYGSEVEFMKTNSIGKPADMDKGKDLPLAETGRAYFGEYLEGEVVASDFGVYDASGTIAETLASPLAKQLQRLNAIRRAVPALQKGQYSLAGIEGEIAFKRRYTDAKTDSYALITITKDATFHDVLNGTYTDVITGDVQEVTNNTLSVKAPGKGNMRVYVLDTELTKAPGKIGEDGIYLK